MSEQAQSYPNPQATGRRVRKLVIVGGGTAGWITAAAFARYLGKVLEITLVESDAIGTVGVGEATIPQIRRLNQIMGFNEDDFVRRTQATFKLGIEFKSWQRAGEAYLHTFGDAGISLASLPFHHYWLRHRLAGGQTSLWDYSLHNEAAYSGRFGRLDRVGDTAMGGLHYAFHFDSGLYAAYLREAAESLGVHRLEGRIVLADQEGETGDITAIQLESGAKVEGDFFIDCSGFRSLILGETMGVGFEDWSHWLPCDGAVVVPSAPMAARPPYTRAEAHSAGWQWRIPLQHRTGNGHVFCSAETTEEAATDTLLAHLDTPVTAEPRILRFRTGRRNAFWTRNCAAIGLSSGFLEPLESTSIHLIQSHVSRLISLFPRNRLNPQDIARYNADCTREMEQIRDFLILHYHRNDRAGEPFWDACRTMAVPSSLKDRMALFAESGRVMPEPDNLFREASWLQVMLGQGIMPRDCSPMADGISDGELAGFLENVRTIAVKAARSLPTHDAFIDQHCRASEPA